MLTKEECMVALENLKNGYRWMLPSGDNAFDKSVSILKELIEEHFELVDAMNHFSDEVMEYIEENRRLRENLDSLRDNPPLKFEELKEIEWYWDNKKKRYFKIFGIDVQNKEIIAFDYWELVFEKNRFFRKQVEENGRD